METLWHFPFAYATPPRFMPLPVQCGKFQLQYEDTGNFEIDFREEFPQNIKTLNNCEKGDNTFTSLKISLTQILDFFLVYFWCCQVAVLDGGGWREREREWICDRNF